MRGDAWSGGAGLIALLASFSSVVHAQERSNDNAITQAEDAFGFSIGRESLGIYSADNARGFSPTDAGNVRIDGLYFDPAASLNGTLIDSVSIRVGLSAQGYPFAAPSGVVDQSLRKPAANSGASVIANSDQFGSVGIELDGTARLSDRIGIAYGLTGNRIEFSDGTDAWQHSESMVGQWRGDSAQITAFWALFNDYDDESSTLYVPAGPYLPKLAKPRRFEGPDWTGTRYTTTNHGLISSFAFSRDWILRLGAFRSVADRKRPFTNLFDQEQPDGAGDRITIADPPSTNRALSGELRLTHSIADGPRLHVFHLSIRARDARREFGGSDTISFGIGRIGEKVEAARPDFQFGELSRDRVRQLNYGLAYTGSWKGRGEIAFGISRANFQKTTKNPGEPSARLKSSPWLYNANVALNLTGAIVVYAGYARGLEESGVAPANAANRNQPLPVILTEQKDAGFRFALGKSLKGVLGLFDLSRPYFGYEAGNIFTHVGSTRSRGVEFSLSGQLTPRLGLVAGGAILRPRVTKDESVVGVVGRKPVGLPSHDFSLNANWRMPFVEGLELDLAIRHRGGIPATTDNLVFVPPRAQVDLGSHYRFKLAGRKATLRIQVNNVFDKLGYGLGGSGVYWRLAPRYVSGYLTVDM